MCRLRGQNRGISHPLLARVSDITRSTLPAFLHIYQLYDGKGKPEGPDHGVRGGQKGENNGENSVISAHLGPGISRYIGFYRGFSSGLLARVPEVYIRSRAGLTTFIKNVLDLWGL